MKRIFYPVIIALISLVAADAQNPGAQNPVSLRGLVQDPRGGAVSGADLKLALKTEDTGLRANSDESGHYVFAGVPAGSYTLRVKAKGFEKKELSVKIGPDRHGDLNIRLDLAAVAEEIEVTAEPGAVPLAADNRDAIRIGESLMNNLPAKQGDFLAIPSLFLNQAATGSGGPTIVVDGMEVTNLDLPQDAIKRVYVNRAPYSAEFAEPGEGRLEVITKEGSRTHYRKYITALFTNSGLNARNAFAVTQPPMQRMVVDGTLDGPVWKTRGTFLVAARYFDFRDSAFVAAQGPAGAVTETVTSPTRGSRFTGRLDFPVGNKHVLHTNYKFKDESRRNQGVGGFNLPERAFSTTTREHRLMFSDTAYLSPSLSNDLRGAFKHETAERSSATAGPAVIVMDAFSGGGAQVSELDRENAAELQDLASWVRGANSLRFGGEIRTRRFADSDSGNFGGTFLFSSLEDYRQNRPFLLRINRGQPAVSFPLNDAYGFVQDEYRPHADLMVSAGLRYEHYSKATGGQGMAPRLSLSYVPGGGKTVIRIGAGAFYDRLSRTMLRQSLLYDNLQIRQAVVENPIFAAGSTQLFPELFPIPSRVRLAPDLKLPRIYQTSFGVERPLNTKGTFVSAEYAAIRGVKLYRTRNVNAPLPLTGLRPDAAFLNIDQFESSGLSRSHNLKITFRTNWGDRFDLLSQYTLSHSTDDTAGPFALPADNWDLHGEYGRSNFDRRHQWNVLSSFRLPQRARLGIITSVASGIPYNITTGSDDNHDTVANDRPPGVGRNSGQGPGMATVDLRLAKKFDWPGERKWPRPELRLDVFNALNHVNYQGFIGNLRSPFFGRANAAYPARSVQISVKLKL